MAEQNMDQRTERATPKRLEEGRKKGQIPRSKELNTMMVMLAGSGGLFLLGPALIEEIVKIFRAGLTLERASLFDPTALTDALGIFIRDALLALMPFFVVCLVAALLAPMSLGGWNFSVQAMAPKFDKLNPITGLGRLFAVRNLIELLKAIAKFVVLGAAAVVLLKIMATDLLGLADEPIHSGLTHGVELCGLALLALSAVLGLIAAVDVPFQLWDHARKMRMTLQEVRDEHKETEGRPEVKARIRSMQQQLSRRRMMEEVPKADVIVTNPTHFAVALSWDEASMRAPRVVAKGADLLAAQIRRVATANSVPIYEAPPLARALYSSTEIDQEIPTGLYVAVAQILSYVYALKRAHDDGGPEPLRPEIAFDEDEPT